MDLKLYVIPGSHPCDCVEAGLQLKGLHYDRVDLLPLVHKLAQRVIFGHSTVPGLKLDDERVVGSRAILRRLEAIQPTPPLMPADLQLRARVEDAEAWGEETLQPAVRRIAWAVLRREARAMRGYLGDSKLPVPTGLLMLAAKPTALTASAFNHAGDDAVQADLRALPAQLDRVDGWTADGVLAGEAPNVADLQIGSGLRLLDTFGDVRPLIEGRSCYALLRLFKPSPGSVRPGVLPAGWVPRSAPAAA